MWEPLEKKAKVVQHHFLGLDCRLSLPVLLKLLFMARFLFLPREKN